MIDVIEASFDVGIQHLFALEADHHADGFDGIMGPASWSKPVAVGFELGFPLRFQREFDQGLTRSIKQGRHHHSTLPPFPNHLRNG